jgi:UDP-N-acetyl-D-mannosaminuronic acid dehydrogenase
MSGNEVYGIDIDSEKISQIMNGSIKIEEYYKDIHISKLARTLIASKNMYVGTEFERVDQTKAIFIISVGIMDRPDGTKDISPIFSVVEKIKPHLISGDLIIVRSTLIPGTCENIILPLLEKAETPVYFAYCPETLIETRAFDELEENEHIIAAINDESFEITKEFFSSLSKSSIQRSPDIKTAEMAKIVQNIHRDVNIALANEISDAASMLGVDFYKLQELVNTNPRVNLLSAGPGVGGYCLPNALGYLQPALSREKSYRLSLSETARNQNKNRPAKVLELINRALNDINKTLKDSTIAVAGLAMKDYCADCRFSPSLDLIDLLIEEGAVVKAYDPLIPTTYPFQVENLEDCLRNADCLVIEAKQKDLNYPQDMLFSLMNTPSVVVDTRNAIGTLPGIHVYKL